MDAVVSGLGSRPIDVLINNAGMGANHDFRLAPPDPENDERTLWLNLHAPIRLIVRLMPVLRTRPEAMIVNVTSGLAIAPNAGAPVYCATKAALRSYTMALRGQLKGTGVHVLEALPPMVDTQMTAGRWQQQDQPGGMRPPDHRWRWSAGPTRPMSAWSKCCRRSIQHRLRWRGR